MNAIAINFVGAKQGENPNGHQNDTSILPRMQTAHAVARLDPTITGIDFLLKNRAILQSPILACQQSLAVVISVWYMQG